MSDIETPQKAAAEEPRKLEGVGGWLILPLLIVVFHIVLYGLEGLVGMAAALTGYSIDAPGVAVAGANPINIVFAGIYFALTAFGIYCLVEMVQRRSAAPRLLQIFFALVPLEAIANLGGLFVLGTATQIVAGHLEASRHVGTALTVAIIWIPYLRISRRVKNTFVR